MGSEDTFLCDVTYSTFLAILLPPKVISLGFMAEGTGGILSFSVDRMLLCFMLTSLPMPLFNVSVLLVTDAAAFCEKLIPVSLIGVSAKLLAFSIYSSFTISSVSPRILLSGAMLLWLYCWNIAVDGDCPAVLALRSWPNEAMLVGTAISD